MPNDIGSGTVAVNGATLLLGGGGTISSPSPVSIASGGTLEFDSDYSVTAASGIIATGTGAVAFAGGTVNDAGSYAVAGSTALSGGTLTYTGTTTATSGSFTETGGTLDGSGALTVSGALTWTGGTMTGSGVTNAEGSLTISGTDSNYHYEYLSRTLNNFGPAQFENDSGPTLTLSTSVHRQPGHLRQQARRLVRLRPGRHQRRVFQHDQGGIFLNEGTLTKAGTTGSSYLAHGGSPSGV